MIDPLDYMNCSERVKDLEYLKDVLRNNCQVIMGSIKRIIECTVTMTDALKAYEEKWQSQPLSNEEGQDVTETRRFNKTFEARNQTSPASD